MLIICLLALAEKFGLPVLTAEEVFEEIPHISTQNSPPRKSDGTP